MITVEQIKAARGLLEWSQDDLADAAILSRPAINNLERRVSKPHFNTLERIQKALEKAGIEFIDGGVRYSRQILDIKVFEGESAVLRLNRDMQETIGEGEEFLFMGVDERLFDKYGGEKLAKLIKETERRKIKTKLLIREGDTYFIEPIEHYRWVSDEIFSQVPHVVYGDKYAIILWGPPVKMIVIRNADIAESYRRQFYAHWERAKVPTVKI